MKLIEIEPKDQVLKKYIQCYQFFEVTGPLLVKAVPTGTLECWIKLDGEFEIFDTKEAVFNPSGSSGIFPMGSHYCVYFVAQQVKCLNLKLRPTILGLTSFSHLVAEKESFSIEKLIGKQGARKIKILDYSKFDKLTDTLDNIVKTANSFERFDQKISSILSTIMEAKKLPPKISNIAIQNNLTIKSLERLIKKTFGITPKKLVSILRFGDSIEYLNKTESHRFIDTLKFGYYDQSHFIKECRKLTNLNPKEFLSKLSLNTNDLIFENLSDT